MKQATIYIGPQASGKSTRLKNALAERNHLLLHPSDLGSVNWINNVKQDTEVIVLEDIESAQLVNMLVQFKSFPVETMPGDFVRIERPELMMTSSVLLREDLELIEGLYIVDCQFLEATKAYNKAKPKYSPVKKGVTILLAFIIFFALLIGGAAVFGFSKFLIAGLIGSGITLCLVVLIIILL